MAVKGSQVTVVSTAGGTPIIAAAIGARSATLKNQGAASVYLSDSTVDNTGYELKAGEAVAVELQTNEAVYGLAATGTVRVDVLRNGA